MPGWSKMKVTALERPPQENTSQRFMWLNKSTYSSPLRKWRNHIRGQRRTFCKSLACSWKMQFSKIKSKNLEPIKKNKRYNQREIIWIVTLIQKNKWQAARGHWKYRCSIIGRRVCLGCADPRHETLTARPSVKLWCLNHISEFIHVVWRRRGPSEEPEAVSSRGQEIPSLSLSLLTYFLYYYLNFNVIRRLPPDVTFSSHFLASFESPLSPS